MAKNSTAPNPAVAAPIGISRETRTMLTPIKESEAIEAETIDSTLKNSLHSFKSVRMF